MFKRFFESRGGQNAHLAGQPTSGHRAFERRALLSMLHPSLDARESGSQRLSRGREINLDPVTATARVRVALAIRFAGGGPAGLVYLRKLVRLSFFTYSCITRA